MNSSNKNGIVIFKPEGGSATTQNNLQTQKDEGIGTAEVTEEEQVMNDEEISQLKSGRIISTIIVVLFLIHPTITTICFNAFK
jgi:hypothetical protein